MQHKRMLLTALTLATLGLLTVIYSNTPATAGETTPNVTGKWEGTYSNRAVSGQITLQLVQEGTKVMGKQSVVGVMPVFSGEGSRQILIGEEIRDGHLEDSTLIFYVQGLRRSGEIG